MASMRLHLTAALLMLAWNAWGEPSLPKKTDDIICSLAPSQSNLVASISGALGGAGATAAGLAQAAGLSVVSHSSGALILTGSSGYVAGTLGSAALAGPVIIGVGIVVAGSAMTIELLCAPQNHPPEVQKVEEAAKEFMARSKLSFNTAKAEATRVGQKLSVSVKRVSENIFEYAYSR